MKKRIISLFVAVAILLLPLSVISFANDIEEIYNSSFYFEIPNNYKFSWVYEETEVFDFNKEDGSLEYIYFLAQENNGQIENMKNDFDEAVDIFSAFAKESSATDITTFSKEITEKNGCSCIEIEGNDGFYYKGYLFANEEYIFCFLQEVNNREFKELEQMIDSFEMNGTPLKGDNPKNKVDFSKAVSYEEMIANLVLNYDVLDEQTNLILKIVCLLFMVPFVTNVVLIFFTFRKKKLYKKTLEQYEKTFGVMSTNFYGAPNFNMYPPMNGTYNNQQPSDFNVNNYQNFDNQ